MCALDQLVHPQSILQSLCCPYEICMDPKLSYRWRMNWWLLAHWTDQLGVIFPGWRPWNTGFLVSHVNLPSVIILTPSQPVLTTIITARHILSLAQEANQPVCTFLRHSLYDSKVMKYLMVKLFATQSILWGMDIPTGEATLWKMFCFPWQ